MTQTKTLRALEELQSHSQWVLWKLEPKPNKKDELTKVPYNPRNGRKALANDKTTWSSYEQASEVLAKYPNEYAGIGYEFSKDRGITGIDLDHCIDENGTIAAWAQELIDTLHSYTEYSPSHTGLHFFVSGTIPNCINRRKGYDGHPIEMCDKEKFLTITGEHLPGTPETIESRQEEILALHERVTTTKKHSKSEQPHDRSNLPPLDLSDNEIISKAMDAKNGGRFNALYSNGDLSEYASDDSAADMALCAMLAFWTGNDAGRIDRLFRSSALMRDKWDEMRGAQTYGDLTVSKAHCNDPYNPRWKQDKLDHALNMLMADITRRQEAENAPTELQAKIYDAIEKEDAAGLYDLAEGIALLPEIEQAKLTTTIKQGMARCKGFSIASLNRVIAQAKKAHEAEIRAERMQATGGGAEYEQTDSGMVYYTEAGNPVWISNFTAQITTDVITDDGAERTRSYEIQAELFHRTHSFEVRASDFAKCDWVDEHIGAKARITTGQSMKSHLTNAIKYCSQANERYHYAHTGWRKIDNRMVYLHASGAISQVSQVGPENFTDLTHTFFFTESALQAPLQNRNNRISQVSQVSQEKIQACVKLTGSLARYDFFTTEKSDHKEAVRASLRILDLASDTVTVPLYSALGRAPLGKADFGIHLAGQTGWGKTELCALIQQHFGAAMTAQRLPGSWESTENSLEMLLFQAKDTIVTLDDFKPKGGKNTQDQLHGKADRIFRQIGNGSARGRLTSNLEQRAERPPQCLVISTGEDVPRGQSLKARGVVLTMDESITTSGDASKKLYAAQKDARNGLYAQAMVGYIEWLAPRIEAIQDDLPDLIAAERETLSDAGHARSSTNTANMMLGLKCFLQYACEIGAITAQEAQAYLTRCKAALIQIASEAARENTHDKPSEQWRRLLIAALTNKSAHLVTLKGDNPGLQYGWVKSVRDGILSDEEIFHGGGSQIGWIDGDDIYLLPAAAYKAARAIGSATGDDLTTLEPTLRKFLLQDGALATTDLDKARKTLTVRRRVQSEQQDVLHIKKIFLYPDHTPVFSPDSPDQLDSDTSGSASKVPSDVSQVLTQKGAESSQVVDSIVKNPEFNGYSEDFAKLQEHWIRNRVEKVYWRLQYNGWIPGMKSTHVCLECLAQMLSSGDEKAIYEAEHAIEDWLR